MAKYTSIEQVIAATIELFKDKPKLGYIESEFYTGICPAYRHEHGSPGCAIGIHFTDEQAQMLDDEGKRVKGYTVENLGLLSGKAASLLKQVFDGIDPNDLRDLQIVHDDHVREFEYRLKANPGIPKEQIDKEMVAEFIAELEKKLVPVT